jgi:hypothetical protein
MTQSAWESAEASPEALMVLKLRDLREDQSRGHTLGWYVKAHEVRR